MFDLFVHIYYHDSWNNYLKYTISELQPFIGNLYINICSETDYYRQLAQTINNDFPGAYILSSPNIGKDVGGKLALIDFWLQLNDQQKLLVMIHDKKSPHTVTGEQWRKKLYKIVEPNNINKIARLFNNDSVGLIGSKEFLFDEYDAKFITANSTNLTELKSLQIKYNIHPANYKFIGGTMFWVRSSIMKDFFFKYPALDCRHGLENGDVQDMDTGTKTHSWERLFCWIVTHQGYQLKGI